MMFDVEHASGSWRRRTAGSVHGWLKSITFFWMRRKCFADRAGKEGAVGVEARDADDETLRINAIPGSMYSEPAEMLLPGMLPAMLNEWEGLPPKPSEIELYDELELKGRG